MSPRFRSLFNYYNELFDNIIIQVLTSRFVFVQYNNSSSASVYTQQLFERSRGTRATTKHGRIRRARNAIIIRAKCAGDSDDVYARIMSNGRLRLELCTPAAAATKIRLRNGQGFGGSPRRRLTQYLYYIMYTI